jgi:ADP-ribose pyrophosphatase YjhB (NUDIX family)
MNFCSICGAAVTRQIPPDDDRLRYVCCECGAVHYQNPKVVVGCIPVWEDKILLCRRAIEPRLGTWTIPAGYLENGETVSAGARRELWEEALAQVGELQPFGLYNICHVNQIYLIFRAQLTDTNFGAGHESLEARLFETAEIPWNDLAFPVITRTLERFVKARRQGKFKFHIEDIIVRMKRERE